ncbi:MAG: 30S ribosomal protein S20 [Candidatus Sericytochromatia bacterium]|nr:30S ribosomal protein S20 [Candidatus Sericytochromatia bacterium]
MAKRIKSGLKRVEVAERNRQRNVAVKSRIKSAVRKTLEIISGGNSEEAGTQFLVAQSQLDKAQNKGVLHKNTIARRKSRLAKRLATLAVAK